MKARNNAAIAGTPGRGLSGATLGFFVGFAAVALLGPITHHLQSELRLTPLELGLALAAPMLSGSLLRIPFALWVDIGGGRRPMLVLLGLSIVGMAGLLILLDSAGANEIGGGFFPALLALATLCGCGIATFSVGIAQVSYWFPRAEQGRALGVYAGLGNMAPGIFSFLLPLAIASWGIAGAYWAWMIFLAAGALAYALVGVDAWYFQLVRSGVPGDEAAGAAANQGQALFPNSDTHVCMLEAARSASAWALVALYFVSFGGFLALTAWLPAYWSLYHRLPITSAGMLTALFSLTASGSRVVGGFIADRIGGRQTCRMAFLTIIAGAIVMASAAQVPLAVAAELAMAVGMGFANAAVFKMVPEYVPDAVGGAAGLVGGLGAFGGFVLPPLLAGFVQIAGVEGYARGFVLEAALALVAAIVATRLAPSALDEERPRLKDATVRVA
jgi:MFS transporter, NNP family, nitrate/nitrite transporter